jgi:hypothetical protein
MPPVNPSASSDNLTPLLTAGGIMLVAIFLGLWQWYDRRARETNLDEMDQDFFRRQDFRRWVGIGVMAALALAIAIEPFASARIRESSKGLWQLGMLSGLVGLIVALITLALFDWTATQRYARRHRRELSNEHGKIMLDVIRRAGSSDSFRRIPEKKNDAPEV